MTDYAGTNTVSPSSTTLSDQELRALAYFAMGVGSESAIGGRNVAYTLGFAGDIDRKTRVMDPEGNSGYSVGTIQTDLGQHKDKVPGLVDAYQAWARENELERPGWALTDQERTQTIADLSRNGNKIEGLNRNSLTDNGVDLDATIKSRMATFLASDDGISYIHGRDVEQINYLMRIGDKPNPAALEELQGTALYQNSTLDDQARLATIFLKLENQSGNAFYPKIAGNIKNGTLDGLDDVKQAVKGLKKNIDNKEDYIESGMNHALHGTEVFIALRNAHPDNPLGQTWQNVLTDPLVNPTQLRPAPVEQAQLPPLLPNPAFQPPVPNVGIPLWQPAWQPQAVVGPPLQPHPYDTNPNIAAEYATVKDLFLQPDQAVKFIHALDQGKAHGWGNTQVVAHHTKPAGFYSMGNDFVLWNREGSGQAHIGGTWSEVARHDLTRVKNKDGTTDLNITENGVVKQLLHVDPNTPVLRPVAVNPQNQTDPRVPERAIPQREGPPQERVLQDPRQPLLERDGQGPRNPQQPVTPDQQQRPQPNGRGGGNAALLNDAAHPGHREFQPMQAVVGTALSKADVNETPDTSRPSKSSQLNHPSSVDHPFHSLYSQATAHVQKEDERRGRTPDEYSERLALSATALAVENGITKIDHLVFSKENKERGIKAGENVVIVQGGFDDPAHNRADMKTEVAVNTPVEQSLRALDALYQRQAQEAHSLAQQPTQNPGQDPNTPRGPKLT